MLGKHVASVTCFQSKWHLVLAQPFRGKLQEVGVVDVEHFGDVVLMQREVPSFAVDTVLFPFVS